MRTFLLVVVGRYIVGSMSPMMKAIWVLYAYAALVAAAESSLEAGNVGPELFVWHSFDGNNVIH